MKSMGSGCENLAVQLGLKGLNKKQRSKVLKATQKDMDDAHNIKDDMRRKEFANDDALDCLK